MFQVKSTISLSRVHFPLMHFITLSLEPWPPSLKNGHSLLPQNPPNQSSTWNLTGIHPAEWLAWWMKRERATLSYLKASSKGHQEGGSSVSQTQQHDFLKSRHCQKLYIILILLCIFNIAQAKHSIFHILPLFNIKLLFIFLILFPIPEVPLLLKNGSL